VEAEGLRGRESMASDTKQSPWKTGLGIRSFASITTTTPPNRRGSPQFLPQSLHSETERRFTFAYAGSVYLKRRNQYSKISSYFQNNM